MSYMAIIFLLFIVLVVPAALIISGFFMRFSKTERYQNQGRKLLIAGVILAGVELLIGYAVCSNIKF